MICMELIKKVSSVNRMKERDAATIPGRKEQPRDNFFILLSKLNREETLEMRE